MANREVLMALAVYVLFGGSVAATFSSKLIHRFSDEAKALWISRNGGLSPNSWPKRNSLEYFELLVGNDLKRQRMRLDSQDGLLNPSEGSETLFFGNELYWLHYTWIDIGTPNVSFLVALDVGSDLLWVPCDCIQCAPFSASSYKVLGRDFSEYNPSLSSTSKHLPCSHQLCKWSPNCKSSREPCPYIMEYASENTTSSGYLIEDKLHLASVTKHAPQKLAQASIIIGCGRKQSGDYLLGAAPDGLMGLGPGDISVPSMLAKAGFVRNSFSVCFSDNDYGRIFFGDQGLATQQSTPFVPYQGSFATYFVGVESYSVGNSCLKQTGFQALVDSGTSFTFLPIDVYKKVVWEFDKEVNASRISLQEFPWKYCYNASSQELPNIPTMRLEFAMNQSFVIYNPIYLFPENQGFVVFCLTLMHTNEDYGIIGQNFMIGYHMVFDRENLKLGWSPSNCQDLGDSTRMHLTPPPNGTSPTPLPTDEQQTIPNRHAVAPAVAGRASINTSAASILQIPSMLYLTSSLLPIMCLFRISK